MLSPCLFFVSFRVSLVECDFSVFGFPACFGDAFIKMLLSQFFLRVFPLGEVAIFCAGDFVFVFPSGVNQDE